MLTHMRSSRIDGVEGAGRPAHASMMIITEMILQIFTPLPGRSTTGAMPVARR